MGIFKVIDVAARVCLVLGIMISTEISAQDSQSTRATDIDPFSGNVTSVTIWAALLYLLAKLGEFSLKIVDLLRTKAEKEEVSKVLHDLVMMTAERDNLKVENVRLLKEVDECEQIRDRHLEKIDFYREKWHMAEIRIAQLTSKDPPSSAGESRIGWNNSPGDQPGEVK